MLTQLHFFFAKSSTYFQLFGFSILKWEMAAKVYEIERSQAELPNAYSTETLQKLELKRILEENVSTTTIHGIYNIYLSKDYFLKAIIALCFLASGSFCCFMTVTTFIDFLSYGVLTTTSVVPEVPANCMKFNFSHISLFMIKLTFNIQLKSPWLPFAISITSTSTLRTVLFRTLPTTAP